MKGTDARLWTQNVAQCNKIKKALILICLLFFLRLKIIENKIKNNFLSSIIHIYLTIIVMKYT